MGRLTVEAILFRDYPVVQTNVMLVAGTLVSLNLLVDLTYAWLTRGSAINEEGAREEGTRMATVTARAPADLAAEPDVEIGRIQSLWATIRRKPLGAVSAALIAVIVLTALFADVVAPYDPLAAQPEIRLAAPSWEHPFGTDDIGRDVLSRVIHGCRISLWVGLLAVGIGTVAGMIIGLLSGYCEGRTDLVLQRIMDAIQAIPGLVLALAIVSVLRPTPPTPCSRSRW